MEPAAPATARGLQFRFSWLRTRAVSTFTFNRFPGSNSITFTATSNRSTTRRRPISMTRVRMAVDQEQVLEVECRHPRTIINSTVTTIRMCTRAKCSRLHRCLWIRQASPLGPVAVTILTTSHRSWKVSYLLTAIDTGHNKLFLISSLIAELGINPHHIIQKVSNIITVGGIWVLIIVWIGRETFFSLEKTI